ncbi:MAG: hypothetical protein QM820_02585 [Minicystis sp.]
MSALDSSLYYSLDMNREAREVYGPTAYAVTVGDHLDDWRALVGFQYLMPLDPQHALASQYGSGWTLVAVGAGRYDWKAVQLGALPYCVLPVMEVASDRYYDVSGVADGVAKFQSALTTTQNWYQARAVKTFRVLQPIIIPTTKSSSEWNNIANSTTNAPNRWDLLNEAMAQYQSRLSTPSHVIIAAAPYTGASDSIWNGAATSYHFAVVAPRSTSVSCSPYGPLSALCANSTYALGHELGHAFGLQHSCDIYPSDPSCGSSIMQTGEPWNAILLSGEISSLFATPYFP